MMGVLPSYNHHLEHPGVGVRLYPLYTWILLSAMSTLVYAGENQTLANVTTNSSSDVSSRIDEVTTGLTESSSNTPTNELAINRTNTKPEVFNNSRVTDNIESSPHTSTTNTTFDSSSQSAASSNSTSLLSPTTQEPSKGTETTDDGIDENTVDTTTITTETATATTTTTVTQDSLDYGNVTAIATDATDVTNSADLSTTAYENTSNLNGVDDGRKSGGQATLMPLVMIVSAVIAFVVIIFVIAIIVYFNRGRCCQTKRHIEEEYVDCDHELYTTMSVHTNFRHHGARADYQPLNLKDERLITKMEVEEIDDENCSDNTTVDVEETADSGRYLSPEGLIYVTVQQANGKTKRPSKTRTDDNTVQYASVDIDKTNKLFMKLQNREKNKKKQKAGSKKETVKKYTAK